MMIGCLLSMILSVAGECTLLSKGIVLSKYYLDNCSACKRLSPVLDEIKDRAHKANIDLTFREVECTECECDGITNFPTMKITDDKVELSKWIGYSDYKNLTKWISDNIKVDGTVFTSHIEHDEGKVKELIAKDFLSGFDGQWLILFYHSSKEPRRAIFKELAKKFKDKLTIAEVSSGESESVTARYNITEYPFIMGINHGTQVPYTGKDDLKSLENFAEIIYQPAFTNITFNDLKNMTKNHRNGEPTYIVLYKDYELSSYYFNDLAQQFKFKAKIYRSNDPLMFNAVGHHPKSYNTDGESEDKPDLNQMLYLTVYKNSSFFTYSSKIDNSQDIVEWIFNTHFPHVTSINNDNFYTVFHGIKPVILLLTTSDNLVGKFEKLSANWHLGSPASSLVFATLDTAEYPVFKQEVLKDIREPDVVFYDPVASVWYYKKSKLTQENFIKTATSLIDSYFNKKIPSYPQQTSRYNIYVVGSLVAAFIAIGYKLMTNRKKAD